jgi:hypothetical protein
MNYKKIYYNIINYRLHHPIDTGQYGEKHHILPKSLGGMDDLSNIVKLTAREHFICHALLAEMYDQYTYEWYKMNHAFMIMKASTSKHMRYMNSKLYEMKKIDFQKVQSFNQTGIKNSQYGKPRSEETKKKISLTLSNNKVIIEKKDYFFNGKLVNAYRRRKINEIFKINVENDNTLDDVYTLLYNLYILKQMSTNDIADMFETSNETIRNYLKFFDIDRRTVSTALKVYAWQH